jgi:hypothetical protein
MFRCNTPKNVAVAPDYTLRIVPYSDMYLSVLYGNSANPKQIRAKAGQEYEITTDLTEMNDTAILIYCASRIQALNDISACYIQDNDFSNASKLRTLVIGSNKEGYQNTFLKTLNMGNNTLLEELDIRNCPNLTGSINLSSCVNLVTLYAQGTIITSVSFANNGKVVTACLPATINNLSLRNLAYLTDLQVESFNNLETFVCENSAVDALEIIQTAMETLQTVKVTEINWILAETTVLNNILKMNSSTLSGTVYVSGQIRNHELTDYAEAWPDLEVIYDSSHLVTQYLATYVNQNGDILYEVWYDRGSVPTDIVTEGIIDTPTIASTAQYDFSYAGWDDVTSVMLENRTITATYKETIRSYTVTWYARIGVPLKSVTAKYATEAIYDGDTPTNTTEESSFVYNIFNGWDKSTGYITGDIDVYALWERAELPKAKAKDLSEMSVAEVYGVANFGTIADYVVDKDYIDIQIGHDFNFTNVESEVICENTYFDGTKTINTGISLFDDEAPSFTLTIDFEFGSTEINNTLVSCFVEEGSEGFRLRYSGNQPNLQWGDKSTQVGCKLQKNLCVLRHQKDSNHLFVYVFNLGEGIYSNEVTVTDLYRTRSTSTSAPLVLGGVLFDDGGIDYYGTGWINWCKIWWDDLGEENAKQLAAWTHETWRAEYYGASRYRLAGGTSNRCKMSFVCNNMLDFRHNMNTNNTNAGGWDSSLMRTFANTRIYNALPISWRSIIKKVRIVASEGNQSTSTITSEDYIYLPCLSEMGGSTSTPYDEEGTAISWFTGDNVRLKFQGQIIPDDSVMYTSSDDPTLTYTVKKGDRWRKNNSGRGYIYIPMNEYKQHYYQSNENISADDGGLWFGAYWYWLRSPYVGYSTNFWSVYYYGNLNYGSYASNTYGVVPCFSI